jgi:hypothetical protein
LGRKNLAQLIDQELSIAAKLLVVHLDCIAARQLLQGVGQFVSGRHARAIDQYGDDSDVALKRCRDFSRYKMRGIVNPTNPFVLTSSQRGPISARITLQAPTFATM